MSASLAVHDAILREVIEAHGGYVFTTAGDSFAAAFARASDAVAAAERAQHSLGQAQWPGPVLRVRMGLHLGEAEERGGDYFGPVVNTAARLEAAGHGGQVLLTEAVRSTAAVASTDLGVHHLRDVAEPTRLFQLGAEEFGSLRVVDPRMSNLPVRPTRLIGREAEISRVRQLLTDHRLVTVTSVGGSGKTRLAIAVGEAELPHRVGGVWFVDLTSVMNGADVPAMIADATGLTLTAGDPTNQVIRYLSDKAALVLLDNCEHVIDDCASFAERFLASGGPTSLLATSREALDVEGEHIVALGSLASDEAGSPGVRLFVDRATAVDPGFALDEANTKTVAAVCTRLDGMPLAIELAAARITVMTPAELLAGLDDRFALLSGGRRPQRQRTLEATLDWSYNLLEPEHQDVFRSLGVFLGGFDLDAVSAVANMTRAAALDTIEALVAKSLVTRTSAATAATRFALLETVKAYAEDRLVQTDDAATIRDRHAHHFHTVALSGGRRLLADARLGAQFQFDRANITTAAEWALTNHDFVLAGELLLGGFPAYDGYGHAAEAVALYERCITPLTDVDRELADFLRCCAILSLTALEDWTAIFDIAAQLATSPDPRARCLANAFAAVPMTLLSHETASELQRQAAADLVIAQAETPGSNTDIAASVLRWSRAVPMAYARDYRSALEVLSEEVIDFSALDHVAVTDVTRTRDTATFEILIGEPEIALAILASLDFGQIAYHYGEPNEVRTLAYLAMGQLDTAIEHLRVHARGCDGRHENPSEQ